MNKLIAIRKTAHRIIISGLISLLFIPFTTFAAEGKLITDTLHSQALEGNLLGDSPDRKVLIYLPPDYEENQTKRFPVIYLLHGWGDDPFIWTENRNIISIYDTLIEQLHLGGELCNTFMTL